MKKILVPCDFSKSSINAFRFALQVARQSKGAVHLLHITEMPNMYDTTLMPLLNFEAELFQDMVAKAKADLKKLIDKYSTPKDTIITKVEIGTTPLSLLEYAEKQKVDLIIMGSHGTSDMREVFIGSTAAKIVRKAKVPVLVVKDLIKAAISNIVFPNSLELEGQEELVSRVIALQTFFKAKLHVLFVNTPINFTSDDITYERLNAFAKQYKLKNYTLNITNHMNGEEGILQFTHRIKANMIAMATHGRNDLAHFVTGSLAEDVVKHSEKLIWTYSLKNQPKKKGD